MAKGYPKNGINAGWFAKGRVAENKGIPQSEEAKRKVSDGLKRFFATSDGTKAKQNIRKMYLGIAPQKAIDAAKIKNKGGNKGSFKEGDPGPWLGKKRPGLTGRNHPNWKPELTYGPLHVWVKKELGKADLCEMGCESKVKFQWANISREYKRDLNDWIRLCVSCHMYFDRRNYSVKQLKHFIYGNRISQSGP